MGLFEDTVVKAKDAFDAAAKKTNEVIGIQKLKIKASQINSQLSSDFETLGRLYFDEIKGSEEPNEDCKEIVESIKQKFVELKQVEEEIETQRKTKVCKNCNCKNPEEAEFCFKCGKKL